LADQVVHLGKADADHLGCVHDWYEQRRVTATVRTTPRRPVMDIVGHKFLRASANVLAR
jgi:hypothetical protein